MARLRTITVKYWNTLPFLHGLNIHPIRDELEIILDMPSACSKEIEMGTASIGLIPVAGINQYTEYEIFSDYCIGSAGAVQSVLLLAEVPLEKIERILLDYHSRTSVELVRILCQEHWNINPELIPTQTDFFGEIGGHTAGLVIGDRALLNRESYALSWDLGLEWTKMTGLPFVYAVWMKKKAVDERMASDFNEALFMGIRRIPDIKVSSATLPKNFDLHRYLTESISYTLDQKKLEGLRLFMDFISEELYLVR